MLYPAELRALSAILSQNTRLPRVARLAEADFGAYVVQMEEKTSQKKERQRAVGRTQSVRLELLVRCFVSF
jgi:hypothetical protein